MAYNDYVVNDNPNGEGIVVELTLELQVGRQFHISTSYGYAGISPGVIKVAGIIDPGCAAHNSIIDLYANNVETDQLNVFSNEPVIKFQYQGAVHDTTHTDGYDYLPLAVFLDHISCL